MSIQIDQRRYARFEVLDYAMVYPSNADEAFRAVIVDVGLGGVQLRTKQAMPVGDICELQISLVDGKQLAILGEVANARPIEDSELYGCGFRFLPTDHEQRISVAEYVHQVFVRQGEQLVED